jgi:Domain of unknown function (DUF4349)
MSASELNVERLLRTHAPHAPESLRARVLAPRPAPVPRWSLPPRRLALVALPAALGLAVAAAVVTGIVRSGDHPVAGQPSVGVVGSTTVPDSLQLRNAPTDSVGAGAAATEGYKLKQAATPSIASSRLAHTDASLQIRVGDTDALSSATTRATQIATSLGGYAKSVDYRTPKNGTGAAYIELRVPAQNVKKAISRLADLGTIVSQELSVTDLQGKLETQSAQIAQLRRRVAALRAALADPALKDADRVLLQIRLAESKRALAQRLSARKGTVSAGATARISLVIGTEKAIAPVAHRGRLGRMFHSAIGFLALEGMIALYALIVISPFALAAALVWFWRRRSVDRLLHAS